MNQFDYLSLFNTESRELLQNFINSLLLLEREPDNIEPLEEIFRSVHSLKSMAAAMGFDKIAQLTHKLETLLDFLKKGQPLFSSTIDLLFESHDTLQNLIELASSGEKPSINLKGLLKKIEEATVGMVGKVRLERKEKISPKAKESFTPSLKSKTVRINLSHLDNLVDLTGELIIARSKLERIGSRYNLEQLSEALDELKRVSLLLQDEVIKARMIPVENVFNRFPRFARDIARQLNKEVEFLIEGGEIELDRMILDEISDSILHLIRNAIDYGIELPEERERKGKKREGVVHLKARKEKNSVVIEVTDDGRGINLEEVRKRAIEIGSLHPEKAKTICDEDLVYFICEPGFTTSKKVSPLSGRGIGMDIVKNKVEELGGTLEIKTQPGKGSQFILRLPLTLVIIPSLLVKVERNVLAIPLNNIVKISSLKNKRVRRIRREKVIKLHQEIIPLLDLREAFHFPHDEDIRNKQAVVVEVSGKKVGLIVDEILGQQDVVIKSLDKMFKGLKGLGGATILGDGKVALILDTRSLSSGLVEEKG